MKNFLLSSMAVAMLSQAQAQEVVTVHLDVASDAHADSVPYPFCATLSPPISSALEIVSAIPDANGFYYSHVNRPVFDPATGTVLLQGLSTSVYNSWPTILPAVNGVGPFVKNIGARTLVVSSTCAWKSPAASLAACQAVPSATNCFQSVFYNPFSAVPLFWVKIVAISDCGPFNYPTLEHSNGQLPAAGVVQVAVSSQCQVFHYNAGTQVVKVTDEWGNKYIMHASTGASAADVDVTGVVLPDGWTIKQTILSSDLSVYPMQWSASADYCFYTLLLDNMGNGYRQYFYNERRVLITPGVSKLFTVGAASEACRSHFQQVNLLVAEEDDDE